MHLLGEQRYLFIKNVYRTSFSRHALVSYLPDPFFRPGFTGHSNFQEILAICSALNDQKFTVDVVHFLDTRTVDYRRYQYIIGFGTPFNKSHLVPNNAVKIMVATGAHYCFQTHAELKRISEFKARTNFEVRPRRINPNNWGESFLSEYLIVTGNSWTASTFDGYYNGKIFNIPVTAIDYYSGRKLHRSWDSAKKHFLWFGGSGLIHKGLDLAIEAFVMSKNVELHICGPYEDDFFKAYKKVLEENPHIRYHGFLDIHSALFNEILQNCGFVILPSCSEGQASSVITAMFSGLIPVLTRECGIDLHDFVTPITDIRVAALASLVTSMSETASEELSERSEQTIDYVLKNNTLKKYSEVFAKIFEQILYDKHDTNYLSGL